MKRLSLLFNRAKYLKNLCLEKVSFWKAKGLRLEIVIDKNSTYQHPRSILEGLRRCITPEIEMVEYYDPKIENCLFKPVLNPDYNIYPNISQ